MAVFKISGEWRAIWSASLIFSPKNKKIVNFFGLVLLLAIGASFASRFPP
jgi:hypothetical protein